MKQVIFEGNSLETIRAFPNNARQRTGYEIDRVQRGLEPLNWKPIATIGPSVREIRVQLGVQYRIIYIAKFGDKVHILHGFQKKSQKTPKLDIELARKRLLQVTRRHNK